MKRGVQLLSTKQILLTILVGIIPLVILYMPKATPIICVLLTGTMFLYPRNPHHLTISPLSMLGIASIGYVGATYLWSINTEYAGQTILQLMGTGLLTVWTTILVAQQPAHTINLHTLRWFKVALIIASIFVFIDVYTHGFFWNYLKKSLYVNTSFNKTLAITIILSSVFISPIFYPKEHKERTNDIFIIIWFVTLLCATYMSESDAAKLALGVGIISVFLEKRISHFYAFARYGFVLYVCCVPLLFYAVLTPENIRYFESFLGQSSMHRLHSWAHFNTFISQRPLIGWGIGSTLTQPLQGNVVLFQKFITETSTYPHNFAQQVWIEGGFIGAFLTAGFGWLTNKRITQLPNTIRKNFLFLWVFTVVILSFGISIWHYWYWCTIIIATTLSKLALANPHTTTHDP
ncbi:MAG: O-antigen ligase family protein [Alphaproteobacteria bacterium]|nr:MAG: O-antigen ligase family protein [Alphaproteobacteria bacterium]